MENRPFDPREPQRQQQQQWEAPQQPWPAQQPPYHYPAQQQAPQQPSNYYPDQGSNQYPQYQQQPPQYQQQQYPYSSQPQYPSYPPMGQPQGYAGQQQYAYAPQGMMMEPQKSWTTTALLCHFLGTLGVHRFYTGHILSGIFQLLTFGGFGIWLLIDIIMIITGDFKDKQGRPLYRTQVMTRSNKNEATTALLCLFLGGMGIHRFYTGHIIIGLFQFFTFGGFGIWTLVDLILIYTENYTDSNGMPLSRI